MKKSFNYYELAKRKLGIESDYAMAKKLGLATSSISQYRTGKRIMDDTTALMIAEILEIEPMKIIAAANADRETGKDKEKWENFYRQLGGLTASLFIGVNLILTYTPTEAAPVAKEKNESMYIMLSRRLIQWARNLALVVSRNCQMLHVHVGYLG